MLYVYICFFYFFLYLFIIYLLVIYFSEIYYFHIFVFTLFLIIGLLVLIIILCESYYLKIFLAMSSILNSILVFVALSSPHNIEFLFFLQVLLRPRKILYKNKTKKRLVNIKPSLTLFSKKLIFGQIGLKLVSSTFLFYSKYILKFKIFLKKSVKRSNITRRHF